MVERSAETGEHYIARTRRDYFGMWRMAAGGGLLTAGTVYLKFFIAALHLNKFVEGVLFSLDYVGSFLAIHFAHFTLATKQPAMTAPALAQKLDDVNRPEGRTAFVEETIALIRFADGRHQRQPGHHIPGCARGSAARAAHFNTNLLTNEKAEATIQSFSAGPTPIYAAFTGVLLWASSLIAGWADNWFALHRLHDALAYQRRPRGYSVPPCPSHRRFRQKHAAGVAGNVSLGLMLDWCQPFAFVGIPLDVRHVTLSTGSVAASVGVLGFDTMLTAPILVGGGWYCINGRA